MSTRFFPHCLDCAETYGRDDSIASRDPNFALALCRHADQIASLAAMFADDGFSGDLDLQCFGASTILPSWFVKHMGHNLAVIDEYGTLWGKCIHKAQCACCGSWLPCSLEYGHKGSHHFTPKKLGEGS